MADWNKNGTIGIYQFSMRTKYNIIEYRNYIVLTSNDEKSPNEYNISLRKYFVNNKKNAKHYAIVSEFVYGLKDFKITSKSIETALGISDRNLRDNFHELEKAGHIFKFQFSTGKNESTVYYIINISSQKVSKHTALALLAFYKKEVLSYSIITHKKNEIEESKLKDLEKAIPFFLYYKDHILEGIKLPTNFQNEIILSIYEMLLSKKPDVFSSKLKVSKEEKQNFFLEELPIE